MNPTNSINPLTHCPDYARRVSGDDRVGRDVFCDHAAGTDDGVFANRDAAHDGGVGAKRRAFFDHGGNDLPIGFGLQAAVFGCSLGIFVVGEHDAVTDEDLVLDGDALADEGMALNLAVPADDGIFLDFDEGADLGAVADGAAVEVDEIVQLNVLSEDDIWSDSFHVCIRQD